MSSPLSPSKGKAPASDIPVQVRFNDNHADLTFYIPRYATVSDLTQKISHYYTDLSSRHLRFIFAGQLLRPDTQLTECPRLKQQIDAFTNQDKSDSASTSTSIRSPLSPTNGAATVTSSTKLLSDNPPEPVFIHCSVADAPTPGPGSDPTFQLPSTARSPATGLDRLRDAGFSEQDIQSLRQRFHMMRGSNTDQLNSEQNRALEEDWLDNGGPTVHDDGVNGETYRELFYGLIFGYFMGVLSIFWLSENLSVRHKA
ncbi:hypothetical protein H4R35_006283, partial [Dimargaris xerosporica]